MREVESARKRSTQWNKYYWGHLVAAPTAYCNQRLWNHKPIWFVNGVACEATKDDIHNFHLSFLAQQEQIYGMIGGIPVRSYRSTRYLVHASNKAPLGINEISTDFFAETIIQAWARISEGELELLPRGAISSQQLEEMARMYT